MPELRNRFIDYYRQLYERLCGVKEAKISLLCANQSMPNTNDTGIAVNSSARIPTNTDNLAVTSPEDLPLDEHGRSLLAIKGCYLILLYFRRT